MLRKTLALATAACAVLSGPAWCYRSPRRWRRRRAVHPGLVYRTGPYAPNGIPFADGVSDYLSMINERDGGINGVKILFEECETGYATDKGVECYERLKGNGPTGAAYFSPLSTGITFALTEKVPGDKIPLLTIGLRPLGKPQRCGVSLELHRRGQLLDGGRRCHSAYRQGTWRLRQAEGQEDQPRLSRQPLRQGADRGTGSSRQAERLHVQGRFRSRIRASSRSRSGWRSARIGRTTCCCGAGAS